MSAVKPYFGPWSLGPVFTKGLPFHFHSARRPAAPGANAPGRSDPLRSFRESSSTRWELWRTRAYACALAMAAIAIDQEVAVLSSEIPLTYARFELLVVALIATVEAFVEGRRP
ncbi:hypothetical protein EPN29_11695 [bacterium]|nr:MAG: hypothetical protein EPN29_11695 [bacterium]